MEPINEMRKIIVKKNLDGVIINQRDNFAWVTKGGKNNVVQNTGSGEVSIYITLEEKYLITNNIEEKRILEEELQGHYKTLTYNWYEKDKSNEFLAELQDKVIGSDNKDNRTIDISKELIEKRLCLDELEKKLYKEIAYEAAKAVENVCRKVEPNMNEKEVEAMIAHQSISVGLNPTCILVGSDERIFKYRHPIPTNKKIRNYLMVTLGAEKYGLNVSLTRLVYFGIEIPNEIKEKFYKVNLVLSEFINHTISGVSYSGFFNQIKKSYKNVGYDQEWQLHHQGGPTAYSLREFIINEKTESKIKENQAYAWNPTITGVKAECTLLLEKGNKEIITNTNDWPMTNYQGWELPNILIR